jgi:hypothetical protein
VTCTCSTTGGVSSYGATGLGPGPRRDEGTTEYWHIAHWYGRDSFPIAPTAVYPSNHIGQIEDGLKKLAEACERIRFEGVKDIPYAIMDSH